MARELCQSPRRSPSAAGGDPVLSARPLLGRAAVSAQMAPGTTRIHCIEIIESSYSRFKRGCLLDRELQNDVFLSGRLHP